MPRTLLDKYMREAAAAMARNNKTLGERIKEARETRSWKQKELAARVHVEPMTVSRWERGVNQPDVETLRLIAQATQTPLSLFVEDRDERKTVDAQLTVLTGEIAGVREALETVLAEIREIRRALPSSTTLPPAKPRRASAGP